MPRTFWPLIAPVAAACLLGPAGALAPRASAHDLPRAFSSITAGAGVVRGPQVRLSTTRAPAGRRVRLRAWRLGSSVRTSIVFGGRRLRVVRSRPGGTLRTSFRVPARMPGVYTVTVRAGPRKARVRFRIQATPVRPTPPPKRPEPIPPARAPEPVTPAVPDDPPAPPTLVAAGDIACDPRQTFNQPLSCRHGPVSDRVLALEPDAVATLGDGQYETATLSDYLASYDPTWGRFKSITRPATGNHEYLASPDRTQAAGHFQYFGALAGEPSKGYYSYDIGSWLAIVINTGALDYTLRADNTLEDDCYPVSCKAGSAQDLWLRALLASQPPDRCVLAYWHHPRYASAHPGSHKDLRNVYDALRDGGAELALAGHSHAYERFAPMDADGTVDPAFGVREFVVGTGGKDRRFADPAPPFATGSEFRLPNAGGFGVLELELASDRYEARFVGENGAILDQASGSCHGPPQAS